MTTVLQQWKGMYAIHSRRVAFFLPVFRFNSPPVIFTQMCRRDALVATHASLGCEIDCGLVGTDGNTCVTQKRHCWRLAYPSWSLQQPAASMTPWSCPFLGLSTRSLFPLHLVTSRPLILQRFYFPLPAALHSLHTTRNEDAGKCYLFFI